MSAEEQIPELSRPSLVAITIVVCGIGAWSGPALQQACRGSSWSHECAGDNLCNHTNITFIVQQDLTLRFDEVRISNDTFNGPQSKQAVQDRIVAAAPLLPYDLP